jgi:Zn-dependent M28 family amino/carboxypeptidase
VSGSYQNEVLAVEFLNKTIQEIIATANPAHKIEFDLQKAHGSFFIPFEKHGYPVTSVYRGLQNVVVKVTPADHEPKNYLLLNAHFDTVPTSPGAGDDATMCAVMLEIMRKITQKSDTYKHGLVFLFNGLEENTLQASHAFISHHRWFPKIRAVINLEGASSGGRELMFQAGPEFPFLMRYYSKYIHHPFCNAIAEEVFQAGLVPSRTDYENFVNFGKIPGMDFAFNSHGYLYHTKYDAINTVPLETLQHTGDNILDLTKALANADELFDIEVSVKWN